MSNMRVVLLAHTPNAKRVAFAAIRSCYSPRTSEYLFNEEFNTYEKRLLADGTSDSERLIKQIVSSGHTSTLEHITFTFSIQNVSRALLAQLTRHRIGFSYSVQSQRYVKQSSDSKHGKAGFVKPDFSYIDEPQYRKQAEEILAEGIESMQTCYDMLVGLGVRAEDARCILGQGSTCNLTLTCNLRAFLDFYGKRRKGTHAQAEIQELAERMREIIVEAEPWIEQLIAK